ncbi:hypothetical protein GYMLUDRAFT_65374 [Collybiopsis luxurians FD-317 M1]|uniref:Uncharacterized protein n=1 Tax=Collybiopsis luxurians FD-317 M1 TaxID=944289 RepID=A0A0D0BL75_9AGAR|nr:hypothetical protein GYMLUDRAFT_65374 [Collybiopsis luxurians FD-317 M1]
MRIQVADNGSKHEVPCIAFKMGKKRKLMATPTDYSFLKDLVRVVKREFNLPETSTPIFQSYLLVEGQLNFFEIEDSAYLAIAQYINEIEVFVDRGDSYGARNKAVRFASHVKSIVDERDKEEDVLTTGKCRECLSYNGSETARTASKCGSEEVLITVKEKIKFSQDTDLLEIHDIAAEDPARAKLQQEIEIVDEFDGRPTRVFFHCMNLNILDESGIKLGSKIPVLFDRRTLVCAERGDD